MTASLGGQTALVTGASRGIGRAIALRLAAAEARVYALARDPERLDTLVAEGAGAIEAVPCDLTDHSQLDASAAQCADAGILVNNAGWAPPRTRLDRMRPADLERTLTTCLLAPIRLTRALLPSMRRRGDGAIVQILSPAAKLGRAGESGYAAAKSGLRGFTESLREELDGTAIRVTSIYPGYVDTDFIPANKRVDRAKFLRPDDVAQAVLDALTRPPSDCPAEISLPSNT